MPSRVAPVRLNVSTTRVRVLLAIDASSDARLFSTSMTGTPEVTLALTTVDVVSTVSVVPAGAAKPFSVPKSPTHIALQVPSNGNVGNVVTFALLFDS
ncbi:hypothetical protein D3C86_1895640 [compost metagenome]